MDINDILNSQIESTSKTPFQVVRGLEKNILDKNPTNGCVWFAVDTKKIYYSTGTEFLSMGGSSNIFYGIKDTSDADSGQIYFVFTLEEIENTERNIPLSNDLILNSDGCFYRVISIENDEILVKKLTIAGSGSGGGGGGTSGTANVSFIGSSNINVLYGTQCLIKFDIMAKDSAGDNTSGGRVSWFLDNIPIVSNIPVTVGINEFDVGPYLKQISSSQSLRGVFSLDVGVDEFIPIRKTWTITAFTLDLSWNYNSSIVNLDNNFTIFWNAIGGDGQIGSPNAIEKITHIIINELNKEILVTSISNQTQNYTLDRESLGLNHGSYTITLYVTAEINQQEFRSKSITYEIIFANENNTLPIIAIGQHNDSMMQYNTMEIPIYIYNSSIAYFQLDGKTVETITDLTSGEGSAATRIWLFTPITSGMHSLTINCVSVEKTFSIMVEKLNINNEEVGGWSFRLKANEFTSKSKEALLNWSDNGVSLSFSDNFDWVNGGLQTEIDENGNSRQYLCIKSGTNMYINYKPLQSFNANTGKCIKIIFKITKCGNYDAEAISCYTNNGGGFKIKAQNAMFQTSAQTIVTQYCEDSYIEYEMDIQTNPKYLTSWINGVPAGVKTFDADRIQQLDPQIITVGSSDCDVYLYLFKVYDKHLSNDNHINNFIADASNAQEMLKRYNRNNIISDERPGEIDWKKLVTNNPDIYVQLYDIEHITKNKNDMVAAREYLLYHTNPDAPMAYSGSNYGKAAVIKVQGTSSAAYVVSAANLDTSFKAIKASDKSKITSNVDDPTILQAGLFDTDGKEISKLALGNDDIPVNYFNTKVNVASCENANNALNAEWYNRYQPYICLARKNDPQKRDTMKFYPSVIFITDRNTETSGSNNTGATITPVQNNVFSEIPGYVNNPYYKMYSIGNLGNSKKNAAVLHDINNPYEICIEVTDNNGSNGYFMTAAMGYKKSGADYIEADDLTNKDIVDLSGNPTEWYDQWINTMDDNIFDVRYSNDSDGIESMTLTQANGFFKLVKWFAMNDPNCKYDINNPLFFTLSNTNPQQYISNNSDIIFEKNKFYYQDTNNNNAFELYEEEIPPVDFPLFLLDASHPHGYDNKPLNEPVTFGAYVFKEQDWKGDPTILGGLRIEDYAGTYTHDTKEYRMAKLLNECEDHLIMDSFVYHYLFIERHTMVDNVAKNTFWTSEDKNNQYWCIIKDYDNDTADGNDNSGNLTLTYGYEAMDKVNNSNAYVFNAHQTVWFNFIYNLPGACQMMYENRSNAGAWDAIPYLNLFESFQSNIPERCWVEDYYRKYLRPYEVYKDATYLPMLEGGKKTEQRKQFEVYQEVYLGTKYKTSKICSTSNSIYIRGNSQAVALPKIEVTLYADAYIRTQWGQTEGAVIRAKRGQPYYIQAMQLHEANDETIYWFAPSIYSTIGDISVLMPKSIDLNGASRIQEFIIDPGSNVVSELESISFINNTLLKKLIIKNCINLGTEGNGQSLNLSSLTSLRELNTQGSAFTTIILPNGAPLTSVQLNRVKALIANNLNNLQTLTLENYNNLTQLYLNNVDNNLFNSLNNLIINANNLDEYMLHNVNWKINNPIQITNSNIGILDELYEKNASYYDGENIYTSTPDQALTGSLFIAADAYNNNNSYNIYNKYYNMYPNLDISFEGDLAKLFSAKIEDGNGQIVWMKKFAIGTQLTEEFFNGLNLDEIKNSKIDTIANVFEFNNQWEIIDENSNEILLVIDTDEYPILDTIINANIIIRPIFIQTVRKYQVIFKNNYDRDWQEIKKSINYGTPINEIEIGIVPWKDDKDLPLYQTWKFIGYALKDGGIVISDTTMVAGDLILYAQFVESSVYDNINLDIFSVVENNMSYPGNTYNDNDTQYQIKNGCAITIVNNLIVKGKITIPRMIDNKPVIAIQGFNTSNCQMTHVFLEGQDQHPLRVIRTRCFKSEENSSLIYFDFNVANQLRIVENEAFMKIQEQPRLINESISKNIKQVGQQAFNNSFKEPTLGVFELPSSLTNLGQSCFSYQNNFKDNSVILQLGTENNPCVLEDIGGSIFIQNAANTYKKVNLYIYNAPTTNIIDYLTQFFGSDVNLYPQEIILHNGNQILIDWQPQG